MESDALVNALQELATIQTKLTRIQCELHADGDISMPDDTAAMHLDRIAQEAVNNAVKHANARRIVIRIGPDERHPELTCLTIEDDGVGISQTPEESAGFGLQIMSYRSRMIGAQFDARRGPQGGTVVVCTLSPRSLKPEAEANHGC
jgi:signal transduction histidine kinase